MSSPPAKVTVIMIVHNGSLLIEESIRSVLDQDFDDYELLVVDDGSTDDTADIVGSMTRENPNHIRCMSHPDGRNHGMSATRKLGVESCSSPLIIFLDHDDLMMPSALTQMVQRLDDHPEAMATFGPNQRFWTDDEGKKETQEAQVQFMGFDLDRIAAPPGITALFLSNSSSVPISPMMRRSAYLDVGGYEQEFKGMYEDQVFLTKLLLEKSVYIDARTWIRYRQHDGSCVAGSFKRSNNAYYRHRFLKWFRNHLSSHDIRNAQLSSILESQLALNRSLRRKERWQRMLKLWQSS